MTFPSRMDCARPKVAMLVVFVLMVVSCGAPTVAPPRGGLPAAGVVISAKRVILLSRLDKHLWWGAVLTHPEASNLMQLSQTQIYNSGTEGLTVGADLGVRASAWEYAIRFSADSGVRAMAGNIHGNEQQIGPLQIRVGNRPVRCCGADYGTNVTIVRDSKLDIPTVGRIADVTTRYREAAHQLVIDVQIHWHTAGKVTLAYPAMWPLDSSFDSLRIGTTSVASRPGDPGLRGRVRAAGAVVRQSHGPYEARLVMRDTRKSLAGWAHSEPLFTSVSQPRGMTKIYFTRVSGPTAAERVRPDETWTSSAQYSMARRGA